MFLLLIQYVYDQTNENDLISSISLASDNQLAQSFFLFFVAYVFGELLIYLGLSYLKKSTLTLRIHAISLFVQEMGSAHWAERFTIASARHELFAGLMALATVFGMICIILQPFDPNLSLALTGLFSILSGFLLSSVISDIFFEIETLMEAKTEYLTKDGKNDT